MSWCLPISSQTLASNLKGFSASRTRHCALLLGTSYILGVARYIKSFFSHSSIVLVLKQLFFPSQLLSVWCITRTAGCFKRGQNLNILIWISKYFSWHYRGGCVQSKASKLCVCTTNVRESGIFHALSLYSSLISLLSRLFSYLQEKNPQINYICLTFQAACCHFAICRPACPVQCDVFTEPLWLSEQRGTLFSCFSPQFRAFFSLLSGLLMRLV